MTSTQDHPRDLRWFIDELRRVGALRDVTQTVEPVHELGAVLRAVERTGQASLFHSVKGHEIPVLGGALGSNKQIALALGCEAMEVGTTVLRRLEQPLEPVLWEGPAP